MKVEFLNEQGTRAIITIGWFRKKQAEVSGSSPLQRDWKFVLNGLPTPSWVDSAVASTWYKQRNLEPWKPVAKLPVARLLHGAPQED